MLTGVTRTISALVDKRSITLHTLSGWGSCALWQRDGLVMFKVLVLAAGVCKSNLQSCSLRMSSTLSLSVRSRVSAVSDLPQLHGRLHRHPGHPRLLQRKTLRERVSLSQSSVRRNSLPLALLLLRHSERREYRGGFRGLQSRNRRLLLS